MTLSLESLRKHFGSTTEPAQHIQTAISHIFLHQEQAFKLYRHDNRDFNTAFQDLSNKATRFAFTRSDFAWNHRLTPEIYQSLNGLKQHGTAVNVCDATDEADELVIQMRRFDSHDIFLHKLLSSKFTQEECYVIGQQFAIREQRAQEIPLPLPKYTNAYDDMRSRYNDILSWIDSQLPRSVTQPFLDALLAEIETHKAQFTSENVEVCLDVHADNALYRDGSYLPIDTFAPNPAWLYGYRFINVYRLGADVYVFLGKDAFESVLRGYENARGEALPRSLDRCLLLYSELIMWPYQLMLAEHDKTRKHTSQVHENFIRALLSTCAS